MNERYVLAHSLCKICVWGENGFYNPMCAHCRYVTYSKQEEPQLMTRDTAEMLGLVDKNYAETVDTVKHGRWKQISPAGIHECSECGGKVITSDIECYVYCHQCGALMDKDEDDE